MLLGSAILAATASGAYASVGRRASSPQPVAGGRALSLPCGGAGGGSHGSHECGGHRGAAHHRRGAAPVPRQEGESVPRHDTGPVQVSSGECRARGVARVGLTWWWPCVYGPGGAQVQARNGGRSRPHLRHRKGSVGPSRRVGVLCGRGCTCVCVYITGLYATTLLDSPSVPGLLSQPLCTSHGSAVAAC